MASPTEQLMSLHWDSWEAPNAEIQAVAHQFIRANCYNPKVVAQFEECQVSK